MALLEVPRAIPHVDVDNVLPAKRLAEYITKSVPGLRLAGCLRRFSFCVWRVRDKLPVYTTH
ncbi:MAG: hypothetical protein M3294_07335, partial [Pseudomonadota bacterium]|nr:hypothetical protein [Pseudomonadota bacterium]